MLDVLAVVSWWIIIQALGLAVWPLAFRLLRWLPDRGYMLAKPLGLLLVGYALWLPVSLGVMQNNLVGIGVAFIAVIGLSQWLYRRGRTASHGADAPDSYATLFAWLREHRWLVISYELLFVAAFVMWAVYRSYVPEVISGEKPMQLTFFNAARRSLTFPPGDPWLAGYPISYYYFGYVLLSIMSKVSNAAAGVAFNLGSAFWFALSASTAFGLVGNLVMLTAHQAKRTVVIFGLLGALLLVMLGNYKTPLEVVRMQNTQPSEFWTWLDVVDFNKPDVVPPNRQPAWLPPLRWEWWLHGSELIHDYPPANISPYLSVVTGQPPDDNTVYQWTLSEFPQFSFVLGDMHAHVLNIPFVLLALGLALNLYLSGQHAATQSFWRLPVWPLYPLVLGGVAFVNIWDLPTYLLLLVAAFALGRWQTRHLRVRDVLSALLTLGILGWLLYLPFYRNFASQASGIAPNIFNGTRASQFFLMFGPFIVIGLLFGLNLIDKLIKAGALRPRSFALRSIGGGLLLIALAIGAAIILALIVFRPGTAMQEWLTSVIAQLTERGLTPADQVRARLADPWLPLALAIGSASIIWLWRAQRNRSAEPSPISFVLLLFAVGLLLALIAEFAYVMDIFQNRMNTPFKLYYQTWVLWSVASAYGLYVVLQSSDRIASRAGRVMAVALFAGAIGLALFYPALAIPSRIGEYAAAQPRLDAMLGTAESPRYPNAYDSYLAAQWLNENVAGAPTILEGADDDFRFRPARSRISSWTGLPTPLGWYWHEVQWRGTETVQRQRLPDIDKIYSTTDPAEALELLKRYDIQYIFVGPSETKRYPAAGLAKFQQMLPIAFQQDDVTIYRNSLATP